MGRFADRSGVKKALLLGSSMLLVGVLVTLPDSIPIILVGISIATAGFFGAHSVVSSAVNRLAPTAKSQASALYLLAYYIGGSVFGSGLGFFWDSAGWRGVVAGLAIAATITIVLLAFTPEPPVMWQEEAG
jgi:YNFM family putative membrane transporter